jgi:hypothetical protein
MNKKSPKNTIFRLMQCSHATILSAADSGHNDTELEEREVAGLEVSGKAELRERLRWAKMKRQEGALDEHEDYGKSFLQKLRIKLTHIHAKQIKGNMV